jgi:ribosomal protein S18 acetylase RimI-like enzyme
LNYTIRPLGAADAEVYHRLRLESLLLHPEAFGASYEDEVLLTPQQVVDKLSVPRITRFGGFSGNDLVGLVGLQIRSGLKEEHKAYLFSMYVNEAHRGSKLAERLVEAVITGARENGAVVVHLSVTVGNATAQRFYRRMGFAVYGIERRSLKVNGAFHDEELMALDLD